MPLRPEYLAFVAPLWIAVFIGLSVLYRLKAGKPIFLPEIPDALFIDKRASGWNDNSFFGQFCGARRCLVVAVTPEALTGTPRFPFNLMFLPEIYGMEFTVSGQNISSFARGKFLFFPIVRIQFTDQSGKARRYCLKVADTESLIAALNKLTGTPAFG